MRNKASTDVSKASTNNIHQWMSASTDKASTANASMDESFNGCSVQQQLTVTIHKLTEAHELTETFGMWQPLGGIKKMQHFHSGANKEVFKDSQIILNCIGQRNEEETCEELF